MGHRNHPQPAESTEPLNETARRLMPDNSVPDDSVPSDSTPGDSTPRDSTPGDSTPGDSTPGDMPPDPFGVGDPFDVSDPGLAHTPTGDSEDETPTQNDPFGGFGSVLGPMMGDLTKMLSQQTQDGWHQARQYAVLRASGESADRSSASSPTRPSGTPVSGPVADPPVNPLDRIRIEELVAIVERHVVGATGLELAGPKGLTVFALTRAGWAADFLDGHRELFKPVLERSSASAGPVPQAGSPEALLSGLLNAVGPSMMAMQIGAMAGQLAHRYFGSGDLPLPRAQRDSVSFIPSNMARFAEEWSLPIDSLRVRVAIDELVLHGIMRLPHIAESLRALIIRHAAGFRIDPTTLMERLGDLADDPPSAGDRIAEMANLAAPNATADQVDAANALRRLNSIVGGYVGHVGDLVGSQLLGGDRRVAEAMRRRRLQPDDATDMLAQLTGLNMTTEQHERGAAFIHGVLSRTGDDGAIPLAALWTSQSNLPTDAEIDAPGLWLARIELQDD